MLIGTLCVTPQLLALMLCRWIGFGLARRSRRYDKRVILRGGDKVDLRKIARFGQTDVDTQSKIECIFPLELEHQCPLGSTKVVFIIVLHISQASICYAFTLPY